MEDEEIIELFWSRDEEAVTSVQAGYGKMCAQVAGNILKDEEDVRECLNDVWLALWNRIPPDPRILPAYIRRVARNLALKRDRYNQAGKRCQQVKESLRGAGGMLCAPEKTKHGCPESWCVTSTALYVSAAGKGDSRSAGIGILIQLSTLPVTLG